MREKLNKTAEKLSKELLESSRRDERNKSQKTTLSSIDKEKLSESLETDAEKKAFWLNIYNAYIQILLRDKPSRFDRKFIFFHRRYVDVAGKSMSLEKLEHGLLRGGKFSFTFGYLRNPLAGFFERKFRVKEVDPRIHFALNCGAKACPPIKFYDSKKIDEQLDKATESYLSQEVEVEDEILRLPRVFLWFRGDFGGKKGIKEFLEEYGFETEGKSIKHKQWNWEMELDAFELRGEKDEV